jgi:hypothetical protein
MTERAANREPLFHPLDGLIPADPAPIRPTLPPYLRGYRPAGNVLAELSWLDFDDNDDDLDGTDMPATPRRRSKAG